MFRIYCLLIGYVFGCFQTAFLVGKVLKKTDIREHGSGNSGATNAMRTFGIKFGVTVFAVDILKTVAACLLCSYIFGGSTAFPPSAAEPDYLPMLYAALGTILGHNFPFFLKFKGGKGAACTVAAILVLNLPIAGICYALTALTIALSKYVSLGSLVLFVSLPVTMFFFGFAAEEIGLAFVMCVLGWVRHKDNIKKILTGTERKLNFAKKV